MQTEILVVGQGISGTWLSYYLDQAGRDFLIIDNNNINSASKVAAGIINPVTGRRIVKTWMIDELLQFIVPAYEKFGADLNIHAITKTKLADFHPTPQMRLAFENRLIEKADFLFQSDDQEIYRQIFDYDFGFGIVDPCYLINLGNILSTWKNYLEKKNRLIIEDFNHKKLHINPNAIRYRDIIAEKIIFCDGIVSANSPYFKNLPFSLNKGEALIIEAGEIPGDCIYKKGMMMAPLMKNLYWVGSSYLWDYDNEEPTEAFRTQTQHLLNGWLKVPFKIVDHKASVRPANVERRPFVGFHPIYTQVGILNGMGTKGCSLAPFFAKQFTDQICNAVPLMPDADISRFKNILSR